MARSNKKKNRRENQEGNTAMWVIGGLAAVGITGTLIYLATRKPAPPAPPVPIVAKPAPPPPAINPAQQQLALRQRQGGAESGQGRDGIGEESERYTEGGAAPAAPTGIELMQKGPLAGRYYQYRPMF